MYVSDGNSHKIKRANSERYVNICCLLETSHNYPRTFKTQPQKSHAVDSLLNCSVFWEELQGVNENAEHPSDF